MGFATNKLCVFAVLSVLLVLTPARSHAELIRRLTQAEPPQGEPRHDGDHHTGENLHQQKALHLVTNRVENLNGDPLV